MLCCFSDIYVVEYKLPKDCEKSRGGGEIIYFSTEDFAVLIEAINILFNSTQLASKNFS